MGDFYGSGTVKLMLKIILVIVVILGIIGAIFIFSQNSNKAETVNPFLKSRDSGVASAPQNDKEDNQNEPPLKLKSIGVNFEDFKFTKEKLQFNRLFMGYGFVIPGNQTTSGKDKSNPQPTFILPLGTPVRSLVDGIVAAIPTVWSGDYSIQITKSGKLERWVYETEHVVNPKVKVGDKVKAGQVIAEVSNFDKGAPDGYGAVEIGLLHGGGEGLPEHVCPFLYLDDSIKDETLKKMTEFFKSWEDYIGDQSLYEESATPGCLTLDPIEG